MSHYYWLNQGRLGNLLFQYAAILELTTANDRVYSFHNEVFDLVEMDPRFIMIAKGGRLVRGVAFRIDLLIRCAVRRKILGYVGVEPTNLFGRYPVEGSNIIRSAGFFKTLGAIEGFFQDGRRKDAPIKVKAAYWEKARTILRALTAAPITVAVHIRLTDYNDWTVFGVRGASVSGEWYRRRMAECRRRFNSPTFVIFSDDIDAVKRLELGDDVVFFHGTAIEDLTVMAICNHIIMSPSTFAWWAAFLFDSSEKALMAPLHWAGFKSGRWYPTEIKTAGIEYFPVDAADS